MERPAAAPSLQRQEGLEKPFTVAPKKQKLERDIVFSYTHLCADYFQSTGQFPDWEVLVNLYEAGHADAHPSEVYKILRDEELNDELELLNGIADQEVYRRIKEEYEDKQYLSKIARATDIPEDLFKKIEWTRRPGTNNKFGSLTDEIVDEDELIRRALLYRAARELLGDDIMFGAVSHDRPVNIVLGMNSSGKRLASFAVEIKYSNPNVTDAQINEVLSTPWEDYAKPEEVETFKQVIKRNGQTKRSRNGVKPRTINMLPYQNPELAYETDLALDIRDGKLLVGRYAIEFARKLPGARDIQELDRLLTQDYTQVDFADKKRFREFTKEDCQPYGRWLLRLIEKTDHPFNVDVLERSTKMGLGPGVGALQKIYDGSLLGFYEAVGVEKKNSKFDFDAMGIDEMVIYVNSVARLNDGKISQQILTQHYKKMRAQGMKVPSPQTMMRVSGLEIGEIFELAGHKVVQRKTSAEACVVACVEFYRMNGHMPSAREIAADPHMQSWPTIRRYCGSLGNLHERAWQLVKPEIIDASKNTLEGPQEFPDPAVFVD